MTRVFCLSLTLLYVTFTLYSFVGNSIEAKGQVCPTILKKMLGGDGSCSKVKCKSNLKPEDCPSGSTWEANADSCGCCPGCVRRRNNALLNQPCGPGTAAYEECGKKLCAIAISDCGSNYICNTDTDTCILIEDYQKDDCLKKLAYTRAGRLHWTPRCNPDGTYAPVQCKGELDRIDSMCFCVDDNGTRIMGRRSWTDEAEEEMNCACTRHSHRLREQGLLSTLHCQADGSYEPLQCDGDSGLCFCVDRITGAMTGAVLPEDQWMELPCYRESMGETYLRQCDSFWLAKERINREASLHGLTLEMYPRVNCDYDGSYKPYKYVSTVEECVSKNGKRILSYYRVADPNAAKMLCHCARVADDFDLEGLVVPPNFPKCNAQGNFEVVQADGTQAYCVDSDGYRFNMVPAEFQCCLIEGYNGETQCTGDLLPNCYNPVTNPTGIKQCKYVPS